MTEWAEREVQIACNRENPNRKDGEWDYGCACYESALKAFKCMMDDGHSGMSFSFTRAILIRLMNNQPLTPIEDNDDDWNEITTGKYQCRRMSSLFKTVDADGSVTFSDIDSYYCVDIHNPNVTYKSGLVRTIYDEMFPVKMPYYPGQRVKFYCEEFLTDKANGDFDTVGVIYCINSDGERIDINRFFDGSGNGWREIDADEYAKRKQKAQNGGGQDDGRTE